MPVYLLRQAEDLTESREAYKKRKQQLIEELEAYQFTDIAVIRNLGNFLADSGLEHISEMDYPLRIAYEQYLQTHTPKKAVPKYIKMYDRIKQKEIAEQVQTLAGKRKYRWCYRNEVLYLRYHPFPELAQEIARLLGHKKLSSVQHYRKMSNQTMADETREVRKMMTKIIYANLEGWGEEYEQIR